MFFMFHILVFIIHICGVNSAPRGENNPDLPSFSKENVQIPSFRDGSRKNASAYLTQSPLFQILRNHNQSRGNNLKSNIFDKMLSDEMFSIKQRCFAKDLIDITTTKRAKVATAPTPTIEVHQKWSVVDLFTKPILDNDHRKSADDKNEVKNYNENTADSDLMLEDIQNNNNISESKILELRSLPLINDHQYHHASSKCSCTRMLSDHRQCTPTGAQSSAAISYSVYPFYIQPYHSYFYNDQFRNPYENIYYHPKVVDDIKSPKKPKRRKTTPYSEDDLYYNDNKIIETDNDEEEFVSKPKQKQRPKILVNIDYDLVDDKAKIETKGHDRNCKQGDVHLDDLNLIDELHDVYSGGIKKNCYCSQATLVLPDQRNTLYVVLILYAFEYFYQKHIMSE